MDSHALPRSFCFRFLEVLEPELAGCRFVKRQAYGSVLLAVIVEIEAYLQYEPVFTTIGQEPMCPSSRKLVRPRMLRIASVPKNSSASTRSVMSSLVCKAFSF